ncbi:hypothetical protein YC2023_025739 [Brassica napus]
MLPHSHIKISTTETSKNLANGTRDSLTGLSRILRNKISSAQASLPRVRRRGFLMHETLFPLKIISMIWISGLKRKISSLDSVLMDSTFYYSDLDSVSSDIRIFGVDPNRISYQIQIQIRISDNNSSPIDVILASKGIDATKET